MSVSEKNELESKDVSDNRETSPQGRYVKVSNRSKIDCFNLKIFKLDARLGSGAYKDVYVL